MTAKAGLLGGSVAFEVTQLVGVADAVNVVDVSVVSVDRDDRRNAVMHLDNDAGFSVDVGDIEACVGVAEREDEGGREGSAPTGMTNMLPMASSSRFGVGRHLDRRSRQAFRRGIPARGRRSFHRYMRSARKHDYTNIDADGGAVAGRPLLTVFGQRNDPLKFQPKWAARFATIEHVTIPKGYHFPMCDNPQLVAHSISAWLARIDG